MPDQEFDLDITIKGEQGGGKSTAFRLICKAYKEAGAVVIDLLPIPEWGMEERALVCHQGVKLNLATKQEVVHG